MQRESQSHTKQSWQAGHERTHSCKTLIGCRTQNPEKDRQQRPFSSPHAGRLRVLRTLPNMRGIHFSQPVKSPVLQHPQGHTAAPPVERLARQCKRPLPGNFWGAPQQADFRRKSQVHMHLPCLPLLNCRYRQLCLNPISCSCYL